MIDYISATLFVCKDTVNMAHLGYPDSVFSSGWERYYLNGCNKLCVWLNESHGMMRIQGSIAYYMQGHNFTFSQKQFVEGVNYISSLLHVDLWKADLDSFEYGVIFEVDFPPKYYIKHHSHMPNSGLKLVENEKDGGKYRHWVCNNVKLKMYDAGRNIKCKQGLKLKSVIESCGWCRDAEYLKWECHYIKPECLNKGHSLKMFNLCNPNWENVFKADLFVQYKRLVPMKNIILPKDKKNLSTSDILAICFVEDGINSGQSIADLKKLLYAKINAIPDYIMNKSDKDARKRQIKILLEKINEEPISRWDLSSRIEKSLSCL